MKNETKERSSIKKGRDHTDCNYYINNGGKSRRPRIKIVGYCVQCGFPIFATSDAFSLLDTGDLLHPECFNEYFEENMFNYVEKLQPDD